MKAGGQAGAADGQVLARFLPSAWRPPRPRRPVASRALPSTAVSVVEKTIFGRAFQMRANSSSISEADGFSSAVSQ